mmetsp:Transcript_10447/g.19214  ORF Transcript_10447/g.19214 Transcript_10447/m.19214 type:complete len:89 (-) Transcript_10447:2482-2748(-)
MAIDEDIIQRLKVLLQEVDLQETTEKMLRRRLEEEFHCSLSDKKMLLRDEINSFLAHKDDNEKVIDVKKTDKEKKKKDSDVKTRNNTS